MATWVIDGKSDLPSRWCRFYNINKTTVNNRMMQGLTLKEALTFPKVPQSKVGSGRPYSNAIAYWESIGLKIGIDESAFELIRGPQEYRARCRFMKKKTPTMTDLQLAFDFEQLQVRTLVEGKIIWFALIDVCKVLDIADYKQVYDRLDDDERGVGKIYTPGGVQEMRCVNEPGLYEVIIRSNSEKAKPFRRWITHEVLPAIRQKGYYALMSDEQLLKLLKERHKEKPHFIREAQIALDEQRAFDKWSIDSRIKDLWGKRFELSYGEYTRELVAICNHSISRYNSEMTRYEKFCKMQAKTEALNKYRGGIR